MLRRIRAFIVSVLLIAGAVFLAYAPTPQPVRDHSNDKLGYLEHRGKKYWLSDLMNPSFRAASDDPFVQKFGRDGEFAGLQGRSDRQARSVRFNPREVHMKVWAGMNEAGEPYGAEP